MRLDSVQSLYGMTGNGLWHYFVYGQYLSSGAPCPSGYGVASDSHDAGDKFLEWQFPLHTGEAFGLRGRILVCIAGFVPSVLYAKVFIRWRQKRRSEKHHLARHTSTVSA